MPEDKSGREPLLVRWSRLKKEAAAVPQPAPVDESAPDAEAEAVELPPVETLTPESDFSVFMQRNVRPELRQAALKKLFADPHFNVMDGLDVYIDDYSQPDPIAASVVSGLAQFLNLDGLPGGAPAGTQRVDTSAADVCAPAAEALPEERENTLPEADTAMPRDPMPTVLPSDTKSQMDSPAD